MYCGDDLRHLGFHGLFGILNLFDPLVAFLGQIGQIVPEAYHAVVGGAVRALLDAVLFSHLPRLFFTLSEGLAKIVSSKALLFGEWPSLGITQHISQNL